jgi:subtilase family serine protease
MLRKARLFKFVRRFVRSEAVPRNRSLARKSRLFEQLEDRKLLAGLLTYGDEDLLGFNGYTSDPKTSAILSGLTANDISDSSVQATHAYPFVGNPSNYPGTDQIYVGSNQSRTRDGYSASSDRRGGPQLITMNYASLIPQGRSLNSLTLGIAADDFQFHQFGQAFIAKINGVTNDALTSKLNSLRQTGPITQFFTIGIDPRQLTANHILTLSIDSAGDGGDGWAIDFLTIGVQTSRYEVYESSTKLIDSQSFISLGAAGLGGVVAEKTFTVRNISDSPLTLQPIILPVGFIPTSGFAAGQVIAAGGSTTFSVRLDSTKAGDHRGILSFDTNDSENPRFDFEISGSVATNRGTDFWLAFQPNHPTVTPALSLFIAGDIETSGMVSIPGASFSTPFTVRPGSVTEVLIPTAVVTQVIPIGNPAIANASDKVTATGLRVTSIAPVSVYGLNRATATTDGFLGLPTNILGTEYIALSYGQTYSSSQAQQLSIVGTSNNTQITITPAATIGNRSKGVPFTVSLNAGQVYFLINSSTSDELSGTTITSSKKVAVFGGHTSAQVPDGRTAADHLTEQLPPVTSWASRFITIPLGDQPQNLYRVLASANQTTIRINGSIVATINRGESYTFERTTASLIETTRPVLVAQFARGGNGSNLDPFMQIVPAIDQFSSSYTLATPTDTSFTRHFANLVVPNDKTGNILRNKVLVPSSSFSSIAGTNFSFAQLLVPRGTHQFESPGVEFGITLYGWGPSDSYGYLGGQVFRQADIEVSVDNIALASGVGSVNFGSILVGTKSQKTFTVRNGTSVGELNLGQITLPNGFTLVSGPGKSILGPNESTTFVVGITTSSLGSRSGELTIANDDLDENPFRILLQGRIDTPVMEILDGSSQINNSSGSVNFGVTARGQSVTRVLTVRNTGAFELSLGTVTLPTNSGFSIVSQPSATVAANGGQTTFQIRLDASTAGSRNTKVSISNSDPTKNPFSFDVLGFVYDNVDLVITDIQTSPTSILGGQVDVNWTMRNQGTGEFRGSFSDNISISIDTQIGSDRSVGNFTFDGTLMAGQSVSRTQRITLPSDMAGPTYIVVKTDASNQVFENNSAQAETNNVAIDDQVLKILAADLQPFDVQVAPVLSTGSSTRVAWKVRNIGNGATLTGAAWQDEVFLSTDKILDANDTRLARVDNPSGLSESGSSGTDRYASFADVVIPYGVFGVRYVIVRSDSGTSVVELNEGNNVVSSTATNITWQPPDLRVEKVISQAFAFTGAPTRVSWDVRNVGRTAMLATEGTWRDRVYLSTDTTLNPQQDRALGEFTRTGLLLPGEGYTQTVDLMLPEASIRPAGDYYLIVDTDWRNEVKEGLFEGNNWTSETSITRVINASPPDLVVDSIGSIRASIFAGQSIDVSFRVKNSGAGDTEPSNTHWSDAVYLSTDGTLDGSDRLLGRIDRNGGLKKDDPPYQQSARFQIPSDLVGNHKLIVVTNVFGQVFGDDATNNQRVTTGSIDIQRPPADLDVISVTPATSTVVVGSPLTVDYKVRNIGPQATTVSSWTDRIYLSRDTILDPATDVLFDTVVRTGTLAASAEYQSSATKTVSQTGPFYVLVQSDAGDAVFEIVDNNNVQASSQQVNVVPTPADLTTSHIVVPSVARSGFDTSISYRVSNTGPNPTLGTNWLDRVYLSTDAVIDSSDRLLKSVSRFGALGAAPEFYEVTTAISLPDGLTGQYHVIVHADAIDTVFEQDNLDNIAASVTKVTVVSQPADLVVTNIQAAPAITVGQSLRLDWTVKNQGTGDTVVSSWLERVYLSDDNVFNAQTDSLLREFTYSNISNSVEGPLEPGRSINRSEVVSFADDVLGDKFLFVVVDPTNLVYEPGAENNNVSVAQPIKLFPRDTDLQVTSVTAPVSATEGVAFNVSWTVKNFGTVATNAAFWYDEVYVSTDNVLSANDVRLGSVRRSNPLSGTGQSDNQYSVTGSFAIPIGVTAGIVAPFFVLVKTDGGTVSLVPEKLENNNVTAASAATTISPGTVALLPDLRITSVQTPTSVQVGQPITVNWSIQNTGPGNIVNGSWFDSVYLSLDQVLDRQNGQNQSRDIFLGTKAQSRSMLKDATYNDSGTFTVPAGLSGDYFVLVATDFRNDLAEGVTGEDNNVGIGSNPLTVVPKAPADLVVGTIAIPATSISGQSATISYTVANNGQNAAIGSWYDAVYISADATWDVNDSLFGRVLHTGDVQPSGTYSESLIATLPGVLPGNYHVIIRSDIRNQIVESNEQNNLKATLDKFALDVTALTLGVAATGTITQGQIVYYKVDVPAGETLVVELDTLANDGVTEIHVSSGSFPTRTRADHSAFDEPSADRRLVIESTTGDTYYILAYGNQIPQSTSFNLKARVVQFAVFDTYFGAGGTAGDRTFQINGAKFDRTLDASIIFNGGEKRAARTYVVNSKLAYATFDLTDVPVGTHDVKVSLKNKNPISVSSSMQVVAGGGGNFRTTMSAPRAILRPATGQTNQFQFSVTWANEGLNDLKTPLISLNSTELFWPSENPERVATSFVFAAEGETDDIQGILRPGTFATKAFTGLNDTVQSDIGLRYELLSSRVDPFSWSDLPEFRAATDQVGSDLDLLAAEMTRRFGESWKSFDAAVASGLLRGSLSGQGRTTIVEALRRETQAAEAVISTSISGSVTWSSSLRLDKWPSVLVSSNETEEIIEVPLFCDGSFAIPNLQPGSYRLSVADEFLATDDFVEVDLQAGQQINDIALQLQETVAVRIQLNEVDGNAAVDALGYVVRDGAVIQVVQANAEGFVETSLPVGNYDLVFQSNTTHAQFKDSFAIADTGLLRTVSFVDGAEIAAKVQLGASEEIVFASALLKREGNDPFGRYVVAANALGELDFSEIPSGNYRLTVSHAGYVDFVRDVTVVSSERVDVGVVQLQPGTASRIASSAPEARAIVKPIIVAEGLFAAGMVAFLADGAAKVPFTFVDSLAGAEAVRDAYPLWSKLLIQRFFRTSGLIAIRIFREQPEYISIVRQFVNGDGSFRFFGNGTPAADFFKEHSVTKARLDDLFGTAYFEVVQRIENGEAGTRCEDENENHEIAFSFQELNIPKYLFQVEGNGSDPHQLWNYGNTIAGGVGSDNIPGVPIGAGQGRNDARSIEGKIVAKFSGQRVTFSLRDVWFTVDDTYDFISGNLTDNSLIRIATVPLAFLEANNFARDVPFRLSFGVDYLTTQTRRLERARIDCSPPPPPCGSDSTCIREVNSFDPNDIIGPSGFGPENWITATQPLNYTIRFENDPIFATAPAQRIEITQRLDSDLDARSFRLGDFGFGELFVDVPENRSFYSQRIDLRETKGIFVDAFAGINVATREAFWTFIAVDPVTGDLPEDPLKGILPPNLNAPEGDGFVRYTVKAKAGVPTGTRVDAQARIVFDTNEPIDTPPIFNTLDAVTPTSQVAMLDPLLVANQARFPVKWSGSDDANGSAIQGFDVYVNVDDKGFQPWLTNVSYTDALYDGPVGATYAFYSVARDNGGNSEAAPVVQDTTITVVAHRDVRIEIGERTIASPGEIVEFNAAIQGATAVQRTFTVRNSGNEPLVLGRASFTNGTGFTIVTNIADGLTLAPNAIASLVVRLDATAVGSKSSTMQFGTDVTGKSPFTLLLRGEVEPIPSLQMSVDIPTISEVGGTAIVTVTRNTSTTVPLAVSMSSDIQSRLSFPATLTIPVGARSASFLIRAIDSAIAEGTQSIVLSAASSGMATGRVSVSVTDDEVPTLSLSISPSSISENGGTAIGTVSRNTPTTSALTVSLVASDSTEVSMSATVTIAAGASATSFVITAIADRIVDGSQQVMIAASSVGFTGGLTVVSVMDVDIWSWTNAMSPLDVDDDNFVSPLDVLVLVNDLNQYGSRRLAPTVTKPYAYVDPDGDGSISPLDVLLIINHINSKGSGEGEGERSSSHSIATGALLPHALDVDAYFSALELDALVPSRRRRNR